MMKPLLLALALAVGANVPAQTVLDFPTDSTLWGYKLVSFNLPPNGGSTQTLRHYAMAGDTVIGTQEYQKLFTDTLNDGVYRTRDCIPIGYLRTDQDQVYLHTLAGTDRLVFDFAAQLGDTVHIGFPGVITAVDQLHFGGYSRKRWMIDQGNTNWPLEWIQGIGYSTGQGVLGADFVFYNVGIHKSFELGCMRVGNRSVVQNGSDCTWDRSLGIEVEPAQPIILLYPNPSSSQLFINTIPSEIIQHAEILDVAGKPFKMIPINDQQVTIPVSGLPSGIYLIKLRVGENEAVRTFVRE